MKQNDRKKQDKRTTHKKVKVVGSQQYINQQTGELQDMQVISIEDRDFNFTKIWMQNIINSIDLIGNQKTRLAFWIIDHLNRDNQLIMPLRVIAEKSGVSLDTVNKTMKALQQANFLRKQQAGVYVVNPDMLYKGTHNNRMRILLDYTKLDDDSAAQPSDEKTAEPPAAAGKEKEESSSSSHAPQAAQSGELPNPAQPDRMTCPCCGEEITPRVQRDKRPGHAGETYWECPNCETELNLEGAKSA